MIIKLPTPGYVHERILMIKFDAIDHAIAEQYNKINRIIEEFRDER